MQGIVKNRKNNFEVNANLIPNSTGQFGTKDWVVGPGWYATDSSAWGDNTYYSYFANDTAPTVNYTDLKTAPVSIGNATMTLSFEYFFHGITTGGLIYYIVNDATGIDIGIAESIPLTTQDAWVKVTKTFTTSGINICALFRKLINTNGSMRIKNVKLEVGNVATKYSQETDIKSLFQYANNGKQNWVDVIGNPLKITDSFATLKNATQSIKNTIAANLIAKGISPTNVSGNSDLEVQAWYISQISSGMKYAYVDLGYKYNGDTLLMSGLAFKPKIVIFDIDTAAFALSNSSSFEGYLHCQSVVAEGINLYNGVYIEDIGAEMGFYYDSITWGSNSVSMILNINKTASYFNTFDCSSFKAHIYG